MDLSIIRSMTETYVNMPDNPIEGQVYGTVWESGEQIVSLHKIDKATSSNGVNFSFGYDYANVKPLFNTSNLFFGIRLNIIDLDEVF